MNSSRFQLLEDRYLSAFRAHAQLFRHQSGATILSLASPDPIKSVSIGFRTPAVSSRGENHIIEHLLTKTPSQRYPAPGRAWLNSELVYTANATTYTDFTQYYMATINKPNLHNHVRMTLDGVFNPLFDELIFRREGWRLTDNEGSLGITGVVYNEMVGWFGNVLNHLEYLMDAALIPGHRNCSFGTPEYIRQLRFEDILTFYRDHYYPGNALIGFWGDDPVEERLALVDEMLGDIQDERPPVAIPFQGPSYQPLRLTTTHTGNAIGFCWRLGDASADPEQLFLEQCLAQALIGSEDSPVAMTVKSLEESITYWGTDSTSNPHLLNLIISDCSPEKFDRIE